MGRLTLPLISNFPSFTAYFFCCCPGGMILVESLRMYTVSALMEMAVLLVKTVRSPLMV